MENLNQFTQSLKTFMKVVKGEEKERVFVECPYGCTGETTPCLSQIKFILESGKIAYMLNTEHIKEEILKMGYKIHTNKTPTGIPIVMFITK